MSSIRRWCRQPVHIGLLALCFASAAPAQTGSFDIARLMQLLARVEAHEATFTEKKQLALLTAPLISKGTLRYRRPHYVERNTSAPNPERFIYENGQIMVEANGRQRRLQAGAQPALGALIESIRATLSGDEEALRRHYRLLLTGNGANWVLELTPLHADLAQRLRQIRIGGSQEHLRTVEIFEVSGDETHMTIETARP
ncbi:MAG: LolA-related protein [Burkholderiales bacterium]